MFQHLFDALHHTDEESTGCSLLINKPLDASFIFFTVYAERRIVTDHSDPHEPPRQIHRRKKLAVQITYKKK